MIKWLLVCLFLGGNHLVFSQEKAYLKTFAVDLNKKMKAYKYQPNLYKARSFLLQMEWDSTLFYTMKELNIRHQNTATKDYCHYFRAISFKKKDFLRNPKRNSN